MIWERYYCDSPVLSVTVIKTANTHYAITITTIGGNLICVPLASFNPKHLDTTIQTLWERWHDEQWASFKLE